MFFMGWQQQSLLMATSSRHGQRNKVERDTGPSLLKDGVCILTLLEKMLYMHVNEPGLFSRTGSLPTLMRGAPEAEMTLKPGTSPAPFQSMLPELIPRQGSQVTSRVALAWGWPDTSGE